MTDLKVNIIIKEDRIFLGAQRLNCDPKMRTLQGDLQAALEAIPGFIAQCDLEWQAAPRNPKSAIPEPVKAAPKPVTAASSMPTTTKPASPANQQAFF